MRHVLAIALLVAASVESPVAQYPAPSEPCALGDARGSLEGVNVRAGDLSNRGTLFYPQSSYPAESYVVPTTVSSPDAGQSPLFVASLWLGGEVGGGVRTASSRYEHQKFVPGQTGADHLPPLPAECAGADRMWAVSRADIDAYERNGIATDALRNWPVHLGAPVFDGDGIVGNFDLSSGDRPAARGDRQVFWAMTDTAVERTLPEYQVGWPDELPLGVDVTVEAFAFLDPLPALSATTFYRYTVTNRNALPIENMYAGLYASFGMGRVGYDYVATDTTLDMFYVYSGYDYGRLTGRSVRGYVVPPAFGVVVVESPTGPDGRPLGLAASRNTTLPWVLGDSDKSEEMYNTLRGLWNDGTDQRERGDGYGQPASVPVTRVSYPGDPMTAEVWSQENNGSGYPVNQPYEQRGVMGTDPFTLQPDSSAVWTIALVFAQGVDRLDSVRELRIQARNVHLLAAAGRFEPAPSASRPNPTPLVRLRRPAPNPFTNITALSLDGLAGIPVTLRVFDAFGRIVDQRSWTPASDVEPVEVGNGLAAGTYIIRVDGPALDAAVTVVKAR